MSLLYDDRDPTLCLFTTLGSAARASSIIESQFKDRVVRAEPKGHHRRGKLEGYKVLIHFKDGRSSTPLTNSDFERLF